MKPSKYNDHPVSSSPDFAVTCSAAGRILAVVAALFLFAGQAQAQGEVRYSWFEISYIGQDVDRMGSQVSLADPLEPQLVDVDSKDGNGIKFRGSVGVSNNFYIFLDFASSDIDVDAVVTNVNSGAMASGSDEFDFTTVRGGAGFHYPLTFTTDIYAELSYDSTDLDFGSFAGENFDADAQDIGASLGIRKMFGNNLELRVWGRQSSVGDVNLNAPAGEFDADTLFGAGFGYTVVQGLSITGDYESGEFASWNLGFRLDLSED